MSESRLASLAVVLLGLFVIVQALPLIHSAAWYFFPNSLSGQKVLNPEELGAVRLQFITTALITILLSLFLIFFRKLIGAFLLGKGDNTQDTIRRGNQFHAAAISVVGLYFMVNGCAKFIGRALPRIIQESKNLDSILVFFNALPSAIELILGIGLFLGSRGLVGIWVGLWTRAKSEWRNDKQ